MRPTVGGRTLVQLQNGVALMREGDNDAVERNNTRRQHIPEVNFAKVFRFQPGALIGAQNQIRAVAALNLDASQGAAEAST